MKFHKNEAFFKEDNIQNLLFKSTDTFSPTPIDRKHYQCAQHFNANVLDKTRLRQTPSRNALYHRHKT